MKKANLKPNEISYSTLINKSQSFEQQKPYYQEFIQKFPLKKGNFKSEKNYNFLFTALFKKIKNKNDWDFVKAEIFRLGLKMDDYTRKFFETLEKRYD
jgi:hypothetical protein